VADLLFDTNGNYPYCDRIDELLQEFQLWELKVDLEALTRLDNSLALAITALNGTKRTHALFNGTDATSNDAYDEALNSLAISSRSFVWL